MSETIELHERYPQSRHEDITDAFMRGAAVGRDSAMAENAKLRELVRFIMHQCNCGNPRCGDCIEWNGGECVALRRIRETGIEVGA